MDENINAGCSRRREKYKCPCCGYDPDKDLLYIRHYCGVVRRKEETGGYCHIVAKIYMQD